MSRLGGTGRRSAAGHTGSRESRDNTWRRVHLGRRRNAGTHAACHYHGQLDRSHQVRRRERDSSIGRVVGIAL